MFINWQHKELNLKVVYYGPALSGKTTNLEQIHAHVDSSRRSELVSLKTHEDRTLFFDFMELKLGKISGLTPKIHLYTVPGQTYYEASRKIVLRGADGVVFVADSAADRLDDNRVAWMNMREHLTGLGLPVTDFPVVVQFNKRDLPNAVAPQVLRNTLSLNGSPVFEAIAFRGQGVFDTLKAVTGQVIKQVQRQVAQ